MRYIYIYLFFTKKYVDFNFTKGQILPQCKIQNWRMQMFAGVVILWDMVKILKHQTVYYHRCSVLQHRLNIFLKKEFNFNEIVTNMIKRYFFLFVLSNFSEIENYADAKVSARFHMSLAFFGYILVQIYAKLYKSTYIYRETCNQKDCIKSIELSDNSNNKRACSMYFPQQISIETDMICLNFWDLELKSFTL